jgi:uncharacterized protein (TIGR02466 family)
MDKKRFKFSQREYFPTLIFQIDLDEPEEMNDRLLDCIYSERKRDQEGIARSNYKELGGWHSHNNLHREKDYADIVNLIGASGARISDKLGYDPHKELGIVAMWSIINPPGAANRAHIHPGSLWSGVYYVQAPENCGAIEFTEPRTGHLMSQARFKPNAQRKRECWTKVRYVPKPGRMIIFPSWLYHAVDPNMSEADGNDANRIIISFNMNQMKAARPPKQGK